MALDAVFGADFETDNDGSRAWMVQYAISDGQSEETGQSWDSLEQILLSMMLERETFIYFHNLKYDLEFVKYSLHKMAGENGFKLNIAMRDRIPLFVQLVPEVGSRFKKLHIRDSMKKIPGSLDNMAKLVNMRKLDGFNFYPGWSDDVDFNVHESWEYVKNDARIVAIAMQEMHALGNRKATFSGDAWAEAKRRMSMQTHGCTYSQSYKWEALFPRLPLEVDNALRLGYFGGINISQHRGINEGEILHADVNSMYPAVMMYDPLPYGLPTRTHEIPSEDSLFVVHGFFKLRLRPGLIPWYIFKNNYDNILEEMDPGQPVRETKEWHEMTLTSIDLELMNEWYDIEFWDGGLPEYWVFKSDIGIFSEYINHFTRVKQSEPKGSMRYHWAKFMMNSLYGRFGLNPKGQDTVLAVDGDDLNWQIERTINEDNDAYLPYAMFITAHARRRLLDYVYKCGCENVIHCDTDSVIHYGSEIDGVEYGKELGQWGIDSRPLRVYEGGFKRYFEQLEPEITRIKSFSMACAGVPNKLDIHGVPVGMWIELIDNPETILSDEILGKESYSIESGWLRDEYRRVNKNPNSVSTMKLIPKRVPGGVILTERQHKLSDNLRVRFR